MYNNSMKPDVRQREISLAEKAYSTIKEEILMNNFPSGEFISISELADSLEGMGRTPVREAVQRLHDERLLIVVPRKGIIIPEFDIKKMMDQLEVRFVLERYAHLKSVGKISDKQFREMEEILKEMEQEKGKTPFQLAKMNMLFHMKAVEAINNKELLQTASRIYDHHVRIYTYFLDDSMRLTSTLEEHTNILLALKSGDKDKIAETIDYHYESARQQILNAIMT